MPTSTGTRSGARTALRDPFVAQKSDDDLVDEARRIGNDNGAYEELYRRHENAARNVARHILRSRQDADDVVNESFAGVISAISNGAGPRTNFRQYLMACVRNSCKSRRWSGGAISTDPSVMEENGVCFEDPDRLSEQGLVASAFSSLSPDWQLTLWLTAVEERPTSEVAEQLGRRPGAVAALAHRAREAFAEAYLAQHQARNTSPACAKIAPKLAHYVRGNSGEIDTLVVERHLVNCVPCSCAVDELRDLNSSLRTLTGPAPLLGAGLTAVGAGAAMLGGAVPLATAGGWSLGALGGATIAKAALIGALILPAAALVANDSGASEPSRAATGARSVSIPDQVPSVGGVKATSTSAADPSAEVVTDGGDPASSVVSAVDANAPTGGTVAGGNAASPTSTGSPLGAVLGAVPDPVGAAVHPNGENAPVTVPGVLPTGSAASVPPIVVKVPLPGGNGTGGGVGITVAATPSSVAIGADITVPVIGGNASVTLNGGPNGVNVGVSATVPVVTIPVAVGVSIPPGGTPAISVSAVSTPAVVLPSVSTPAITTPVVTVPGGGTLLPSVTVLPPVSTPSVTLLPSVTLPSITIPSIGLGNIVPSILQGVLGNH
ncbi:MAG: polymerase, sigma-24 subunit, subfamily [Ilumatobacteraceae bacterium]|nr:polymerase, sigma-24 subunit, subfamily [Ilumatobacteraceae bacterium]